MFDFTDVTANSLLEHWIRLSVHWRLLFKRYHIYPRIGRTFFKQKTFEMWCAAYTRVQEIELINMQNVPTRRGNKVSECLTVWLNVSYEVKLIHDFEEFCSSPLQWVYLVSEYVCYWMKSKEVCMSSRGALLMPFMWNRVCLFAELHEKHTEPVIKEKVINETDIKYHSFEV